MAVQKSRRTPATRGARRAHDKLRSRSLSIDKETGELHLRHHITPAGYYRGRRVLEVKKSTADSHEPNEE